MPKGKVAGKARANRPGSEQDSGQTIRKTNAQYTPATMDTIRTRAEVNTIIRELIRDEGIFSSAANAMVSLAANSGYKIAGYDSAGAMSLEVMSTAYVLLDRLNTLSDYSQGFNDKPDMASLISTLTKDVVSSGGCGIEMVLLPDFTPERIVPLSYDSMEWASDGKGGRYPTQDNGEVELNIPTVFVAEYARHADEAYAQSPLRPGLSMTFHYNEFLDDTRRAVNRVGHSRMVATIVTEKLMNSAPSAIKGDDEKLQQYFETQYDAVVTALEELEPEDAVVGFDSVDFKVQDMGGNKADYTPLLTTLGNMQGASLKTPASVTGLRASGGQGLSNAETLVYLQTVDSIRAPVEEVVSRALTLAVRLLGVEGSVRFEFKPINLRPEDELEAYKGSQQKRILERLSWGLINDAEACYELGIRPQGSVALLAGTQFYATSKSSGDEAERESSTGRALNPETPAKSGGDDQ